MQGCAAARGMAEQAESWGAPGPLAAIHMVLSNVCLREDFLTLPPWGKVHPPAAWGKGLEASPQTHSWGPAPIHIAVNALEMKSPSPAKIQDLRD